MQSLRVLKYGGSSLGTVDKIKAIAESIRQDTLRGDRFVIVVSAMGQTTDELLNMASQITQTPNQRELDMLLTAGERISMALLSLSLNGLGVPAISFTGSQAGILTCGTFGDAQILAVKPERVQTELEANKVVVLAGFQGVDPVSKEVTTLGRGGSDTTAIAMAAYFNCPVCEFKKDTEGIFDKDPNQHPDAKHKAELSWDQLVELTSQGAQVIHQKAALMARAKEMPLLISHAHRPQGRFTRITGH